MDKENKKDINIEDLDEVNGGWGVGIWQNVP